MLSRDVIAQLSQLKSSLVADKQYAQGVVRGTSKRFGFVRLDDGRDAFLDPEQMQRVLPGDQVKISLTENSKKQLEAQLESLLSPGVDTFVGRYVRKGPAHFVEPDLPPFNRWLFIPPQERTNCAEGDLVECQLIRHPFKHEGKAQIRVLNRIGRADEHGIEGRYIVAKYKLPSQWSEAALNQTQQIMRNAVEATEQPDTRTDLCHLPFVTIDSEFTRDMDDALYCEKHAEGWQLWAAIADPGAHIDHNSPLELTARERASTLYLLGHPITMLPPELSHDIYSLMPAQVRPTLVCKMLIKQDGEIAEFDFTQALIRSHHKLTYNGVSDLLAGEDSDSLAETLPAAVINSLHALHQCAATRMEYRQQHALVMEERPDFQYWLNEQKKIERIEKRTRNSAQKIVEETMLATNICAGALLAQHPNSGIFSTHIGFRPERMEEAQQLIAEILPEFSLSDLSQLENFQKLFKHLREHAPASTKTSTLLSLLQRMQQAGCLRTEALEHFGLGFKHYAMITSPIRRYQDLHNHYAIKAILNKQSQPPVSEELLEHLQTQLQNGRMASRQLEQWLLCQYMVDHIGTVHPGTITGVNAKGINVRLDDMGIDGFVLLNHRDAPKPKFDSGRLTLTTQTAQFSLDQAVTVKVTEVDVEARRINLELVDSAIAERLSAFAELPDT